jgi:hypothetical protein
MISGFDSLADAASRWSTRRDILRSTSTQQGRTSIGALARNYPNVNTTTVASERMPSVPLNCGTFATLDKTCQQWAYEPSRLSLAAFKSDGVGGNCRWCAQLHAQLEGLLTHTKGTHVLKSNQHISCTHVFLPTCLSPRCLVQTLFVVHSCCERVHHSVQKNGGTDASGCFTLQEIYLSRSWVDASITVMYIGDANVRGPGAG